MRGKEGREGTRLFLLRAGDPNLSPGLGAQAKKSLQCSDTVDPTCTAHLCFLEKRQSSPVLFPQVPARGAEAWTADTPGNGERGHNPSPMHQDPVASQACGAISGQ